MKVIEPISWFLRLLAGQTMYGYIGATTTPADARELYTRYRRGEPLRAGPYCEAFERETGHYFGGRQVISFGAGRMALYAMLRAMDLPAGSEIIVPGYNCVVTPQAILHAGCTPVYVDVSKDDFNLIPEQVQRAITPRTAAVLAQHTFGIACDMDALQDICRRKGIVLLEDCAHAIGARYDGKLLGTFGQAAFFSTEGSKMISTEHGGFALTADAALAGRIRDIQMQAPFHDEATERRRLLRWCFRAAMAGRPGGGPWSEFVDYYICRFDVPDLQDILTYDLDQYQDTLEGRLVQPYPCRMGNLMSYAGLLQIRRIEANLAHRRRLAKRLDEVLPSMDATVPKISSRASPSWVRFPMVVGDRDAWADAMLAAGVAPGTWLNDPLHPAGCNWQQALYRRGSCPQGQWLGLHVLNFPLHRCLSPQRLDVAMRTIRGRLRKRPEREN